MRGSAPVILLGAALLLLGCTETPQPKDAMLPQAQPASWEGGMPGMPGMNPGGYR